MDELNQIQNPNVPSGLPGQSLPSMTNQMPSMPPLSMKKKSSSAFLITILALLAIGAFAWWYVGQMADEPVVVDQPKINQDAREDMQIGKDVDSVDVGNLDAEFKPVDSDINSL